MNCNTYPDQNRGTKLGYVIFLSFVAALGGFLFGYDTAVISGTVSMVAAQFSLSTMQTGWYVGCALVGSIVGVALAGVASDRLGRRPTLLVAAVLFTSSAVGCMLAPGFEWLVVWRMVGGAGIGVASIVSPLYISEISIARYRGRLVSMYQLAITVGFLGAYLANLGVMRGADNAAISTSDLWSRAFGTEMWRGMLGLETVPALLFFVVIFFIPESPRWMILRGRSEGALATLTRIFGDRQQAQAELQATREVSQESSKGDWRLLLGKGYFKALVVGVCIAILGQFMGVNAVLYYGPTIFESSGLSGSDSLFYQVFIGLVNVVGTVGALAMIDRVGRKALAYTGVGGMILTLLMIGGWFLWGEAWGVGSGVLLALFLLYIFCTAISISAVVWVLLSEMYPIRVRGIAMSIAGFALWISTYIIGQITPWMLETLSPAGTFLIFAAMCVPYLYIMRRYVPDTNGKTLEEIERWWLR